MLAEKLPKYEDETIAFLKKKGDLVQGSWTLPTLEYHPDSSGYFSKTKVKKTTIVLHFTAGYLGGDLSALSVNQSKVSVAFLLARNGEIIQLFDPSWWSYHLGNGTVGGNQQCSSQAVAIEISNIGYLDRQGDWLWTYTGDRYCRVGQTEYYTDIGTAFREKRYYASFTPEQYNSLAEILPLIGKEFNIPKRFLPLEHRFETFPNAATARAYSGVASHVNYRPSGKWDIGPGFDRTAIGG